MWGNERGDTLIEVIIATVIIGTILLSAYTLSTKAFQVGQSAKERTQAAQLMQRQAEGIRALRDNAASWDAFYAQINSIDRTGFHVTGASRQWQLVNNTDADNFWQPGCTSACVGQDPNVATYYRIRVSATYEQDPSNPVDVDKMIFTVDIKWPRLGSGPEETSQLIFKLTDRQLPLVSYTNSLVGRL